MRDVVGRISAVVVFCTTQRRDGNQLLRLHILPCTHIAARACTRTPRPLLTCVVTAPSTQSDSACPVGAGECWRGRAAHDTPLFSSAVTDPPPHPLSPLHTHSSSKTHRLIVSVGEIDSKDVCGLIYSPVFA